jgi:hypothetical protein
MAEHVDWNDPALRAHLANIGKRGGQSRSDAKRAAVRANQKKAVEAKRLRRQGIVK